MNAILVNNVSKKFKLPHEKKTTLFQNIVGMVKRQFDYEVFWALKDISFEIKSGETYGIIGRNGSGKTTLLKVLAKVLYPDAAKDNVFLYSSILGMSRREVRRKYEEIFDFAELKKFESMKLKNFSSGMYLRLAFSTAIHANPDTLLIDEVFAVGDEAFQKKCTEKINEFREQGKTIVFVSHSMEDVKNLCQRSMLLDSGKIIEIGDTGRVVNDYLAML
jgi:lipopolysaccharide transport system ATP-binding protein